MEPAVCLLEFSSIAKGIEAGDAMSKRAPLQVIRAGTVHPGCLHDFAWDTLQSS